MRRLVAPAVALSALLAVATPVTVPLSCGAVRAADPESCTCAVEWKDERVFGLAVSRDGKWLAGSLYTELRLYPTDGGEPVALNLDKRERSGCDPEFSADSKWLVACGPGAALRSPDSEDRTQTIVVFSTTRPFEAKRYHVRLLDEPRDRDVRHRDGSVLRAVPVSGSRMLMHRDGAPDELWDVADGSRLPFPEALTSTWNGIAPDGARIVCGTYEGIEIRDVASNRLLSLMRPPQERSRLSRRDVWFTRDGGSVVCIASVPRSETEESGRLERWSVEGSKLLWATPLGSAANDQKYVGVGASHVVLDLHRNPRVFRLTDGVEVSVPVGGDTVDELRPAAGGPCFWARTRGNRLLHLHVAPPAPADSK